MSLLLTFHIALWLKQHCQCSHAKPNGYVVTILRMHRPLPKYVGIYFINFIAVVMMTKHCIIHTNPVTMSFNCTAWIDCQKTWYLMNYYIFVEVIGLSYSSIQLCDPTEFIAFKTIPLKSKTLDSGRDK